MDRTLETAACIVPSFFGKRNVTLVTLGHWFFLDRTGSRPNSKNGPIRTRTSRCAQGAGQEAEPRQPLTAFMEAPGQDAAARYQATYRASPSAIEVFGT